jgi:hypothetical protein
MKKYLILILIATKVHAASIEFVVSKPFALLNFIQTIAGADHRALSLKEYFEKSSDNNSKTQKFIQDFQSLQKKYFKNGYNFKGYPNGRRTGQNVESLLVIQSANSQDLSDFSKRISGILPMDAQSQLVQTLKNLEPIYDKLIWNQAYPKLLIYQKNFEALSKKHNIQEMFLVAKKFYRSDWPEDISFLVSFYPIPLKNGHSSAEQISHLLTAPVFTEGSGDDYSENFGVFFHEMCHALYESQPEEVQNMIDQYFLLNSSKYAPFAYNFINEALATAWGNGWAQKQVSGKLSPKQWYNFKYINDFGKSIYPLIEKSIEKKTDFSENFVNEVIGIFEKTFPSSLKDPNLLFNKIELITDGQLDRGQLEIELRKNFRIQAISKSSPIDRKETLEHIKKSHNMIVVALGPNQIHQLEFLKKDFPELKSATLINEDGYYSFRSTLSSRVWLLMRYSDQVNLQKIINEIKSKKEF